MSDNRQTPIRLDDTDRKILSLLQEDATLSLDDIAARVGPRRPRSGTGFASCARPG